MMKRRSDPNSLASRIVAAATGHGPAPAPEAGDIAAALERLRELASGNAAAMADLKLLEQALGSRASAAELGRRGGLRGGHARAEKLTAAERSASAAKAAAARWGVKKT